MLKKFLYSTLIPILFFYQSSFTFALSSASSFSITDMRNSTLWRDYVYMPVLNVTLPQALEGGDELHAITVKNLGSAKHAREIKAVRVWQDDGDTIFDSRLDKELGEALWDGINSWDLGGIVETYAGAMRVFVTVDISSTATASTTIRFAVSQLSDSNGNGEYDNSDEGVFFKSDKDGPSNGEIANGRTDTFSSASKCAANKLGPRVPANLKVERTGKSGELNLTWKNPADVDFFSIIIYRSTSSSILGNAEYSGVVGESKLDIVLVDGTTYYYTLKAIDTCNNESFATLAVSGTPSSEPLSPPEPPQDTATTTPPIATEKGPGGFVNGGNKISASSIPLAAVSINDGDLIRGDDGIKVYVVKNGYVRWIQSPAIMGMYGHFQWLNVKSVSNADLNKFYEASLIRADGDDKVYRVDSEGKKHWLNITAEEFKAQGYKWEAIYIINKTELEWYN